MPMPKSAERIKWVGSDWEVSQWNSKVNRIQVDGEQGRKKSNADRLMMMQVVQALTQLRSCEWLVRNN